MSDKDSGFKTLCYRRKRERWCGRAVDGSMLPEFSLAFSLRRLRPSGKSLNISELQCGHLVTWTWGQHLPLLVERTEEGNTCRALSTVPGPAPTVRRRHSTSCLLCLAPRTAFPRAEHCGGHENQLWVGVGGDFLPSRFRWELQAPRI